MSELIAFCLTCKHYDLIASLDKLTCEKYPDGVLDEVLIKGDCELWDYDEDEEDLENQAFANASSKP